MSVQLAVLTAISMSLGWRIRGQFGHEIGAAMAGALGAMAIALAAGREDWRRRVHHFALFGAIGWAFGGSMSYMKVVGYSHSSDSATVLYGFAGLFLIGFLWASMGGAGMALAAVLEGPRLAALFPAMAAVLGAWFLQDIVMDLVRSGAAANPVLGERVERAGGLARLDADWLSATVAIAAVMALAAVRRRIDLGVSLVLHLAIGWWVVFAGLVLGLGLRLNPPRGDNWAGCVGLVAGMMVFCRRHRLGDVAATGTIAGLAGATGFCIGQMIKLAFISTGAQFGWHAVMEWFDGLFFGIAAAMAMARLARRKPVWSDDRMPAWTGVFALLFVLWVIPYLNFRRSPGLWVKHVKSLSEQVYGIPLMAGFLPSRGFIGWYDLAYLGLAAVLLALALQHLRRPLALVRGDWLARGQLLYLVFLWFVTVMSFAHEVPIMTPIVWAMQWGLTVNALACTYLVVAAGEAPAPAVQPGAGSGWLRRAAAFGVLSAAACTFGGWALERGLFGGKFAPGFYMDHIRFGPNHTNDRR